MTMSVITTVDKRETLEKMGRSLLERRLVACLQVIGPIKSTYWWEGRLEETEEWIGDEDKSELTKRAKGRYVSSIRARCPK
jgi:uncharacterized protein involved in tolerance to divalent cations